MGLSSRLHTAAKLLRVKEYVKNCFVFMPLFFAGSFFDVRFLSRACFTFIFFCIGASAVYIVNDCIDREKDRLHPVKRFRPVAAGSVSVRSALQVALGLILLACTLAALQSALSLLVLFLYITLNIVYTFYAKHISIIDVLCIACGFVLRVVAGTAATGFPLTQWLILLVFLLCMFLGLGKRWDDLKLENSGQVDCTVRKSLSGYSEQFVSSAMTFFATISCICYVVYATNPTTQAHYHSEYVYLTVLWVILGIMRYLQVVYIEDKSGSPTRIFLHDRFTHVVIVSWIAHLALLLYL